MNNLLSEYEYAAEAKKHVEWLNWIFGITTFMITLTSLQFQTPWKVCFVGAFIIVPMYVYGFLSFPPSLIALRELCKENPENQEINELKIKLENEYHGIGAFFATVPFAVSMTFYIFVLGTAIDSFSFVLPWIEWIKT
ncbi:hypothetical protein ACODG7_16185 [Vibrio anguillarum]|nr:MULTISPECIES: hypothetical protein [Vibrio]MDS1774042.1 hypothetical protein [Vibrio vulnificus]MDS1855187.1 hypothetical protein [Vibrio vulnificus]OEF91872.1 hypothetical protein A1QY_13810 [Vibrio anguillarum]HDY8178583.1 hypothetical protein [Vibrio vulnificus]